MLTNSRDIVRRLQQDGWRLDRVAGSHHIFRHPVKSATIVVQHPQKDFGKGLVLKLYKLAGWPKD